MARPTTKLLSPRIIADAALRLVRKHGEFTIPGLAAELGVHPSSLYHHLPGGRRAIVHRMRERVYESVDLTHAMNPLAPALERLENWMHTMRAATAAVPEAVPHLVRAPVEDRRTLEIYEALFVILRDAGVPAAQRVACSAMVDAVVLGSALDAGSPVPLWRGIGEAMPELSAARENDTASRAEGGFTLAVGAVISAIAHIAGDTPRDS